MKFDKELITKMFYADISETNPRYFNNFHRVQEDVFNHYEIVNPLFVSRFAPLKPEVIELRELCVKCANTALDTRATEPDFNNLVMTAELSLERQRAGEAAYYAKHGTKGEF